MCHLGRISTEIQPTCLLFFNKKHHQTVRAVQIQFLIRVQSTWHIWLNSSCVVMQHRKHLIYITWKSEVRICRFYKRFVFLSHFKNIKSHPSTFHHSKLAEVNFADIKGRNKYYLNIAKLPGVMIFI